ncbi:hypothetical protein ASE01_21370 [Nocardioides sp. Root190]|uniref:ABC transporter substrate-binding protein n=1 Tax=Nocardioides sp. Root190 TaxID=1736488 RepID=UPI0006F5790D|nr:ABC transporter substrate-binding protein [Nocardioides sp. Root190]KRB73294.1 hypothetical protein ASE01_21370 [Nocardioides sp. Root190]
MRLNQRTVATALTLAVAALGLAACGGSSDSSDADPAYADGKTFTLAITDDPGSLDPQQAVSGILVQLNRFAYDSLVAVDADGKIGPRLASSWKVDGTTLTMEMRGGVTCSDGSDFTAQTAADNINYVADPTNQSQYLGIYLPPGAAATADGATLTVTLAAPAPFLLNGLADLSMVCDAGLKDRASLATTTSGTGPFVLSKAVAGSQYEYDVREDYVWGTGDATTADPGTPVKIDVKVIANDTTAANELLTGQLNAATIKGASDANRLAAAGLDAHEQLSLAGEQSFNHAEGHVTASTEVRRALTQALDLGELQSVLTSSKGEPATQLAVTAPAACTGNSVEGAFPDTDVEAAKAALEGAGWVEGSDGVRVKDGKKLTVKFNYLTFLGPGASAAAELAAMAWEKIGVEVKIKGITLTDFTALAVSGDWDVLWVPFNASSPDQLVSILSGPTAPEGNNFASIENADYSAHVAKAMTLDGAEGCSEWLAAEAALFEQADLVVFANTVLRTFSKGASFESAGGIIATSIKMLG